MLSRRPILLFATAAVLAASGYSIARADTARTLVIRTTDFAFHAPDTVVGGMTRLQLRNEGSEPHHVQLVRLAPGHTVRELFDALGKNQFNLSWATFMGGPESPMPGGESEVTLGLEPGRYAVICLISSGDHIRHLAKGMIRELTVLPSGGTKEAAPGVDVRMVLRDYAFDIAPALSRGRHTIRVENAADQPHHVVMLRLLPGKTEADAMAWNARREGPMPFALVGGTTALAKGKANFLTTDFIPADYMLVCFIPDAKDGRTHVMHGMVRTVKVL